MSADDNKRLLRAAFDGLAEADATAFLDLMAEDFCWIIEGQSKWSRRFEGKDYNNSYCYVIRMHEGKMVELREYMDTALAEAVLDLPE